MTLFLNHDLGPVSVGWWLGISGIKEKRTKIRNKKKKKRMREGGGEKERGIGDAERDGERPRAEGRITKG